MKVLVSIPNTGWIHKYVSRITNILLQDSRYNCTVIYPTHVPYENNLCHIVNDFMKGEYDYWLNIDADNPPIRNPLDLIELDKDIIGLPTPVVHFNGEGSPVYLNAYKEVENGEYVPWPLPEGLQRVDAHGSGCFLISRRVFEPDNMRIMPFRRTLNQDGTVDSGPDLYFSKKAVSNGFEIWSHYDYRCRHFNEVEALEMVEEFARFFDG